MADLPCSQPAVPAAGGSPEGPAGGARTGGRAPKYQEVRARLMEGILSGHYPPGSYLPSESALMKSFGVSRVTVRQALDQLHAANLVIGHKGKGHRIRSIRAIQDLGRLQGFGEIMAPLGVIARSEVLSSIREPASSAVAAALKLAPGTEVIRIERVRIAAGEPMSLDTSYFPVAIGEPLLKLDLANVDVFTLVERELGIEIGFADISMTIAFPERVAQERLRLTADQRVIRIERLTCDAFGNPIDFEYLLVRPETHQFKIRVPRW